MSDQKIEVLGYAAPASHRSFKPLLAVLPLSAGIFAGYMAVTGVLESGRGLLDPIMVLWLVVFSAALVLEPIYALAVLGLLCWLWPHPSARRSWKFAAWLGLALAISGFGYAGLVHAICTARRSSASDEAVGVVAVAALTGALAVAIPFVLVRPRNTESGVRAPSVRYRGILAGTAIVLPLIGAASVAIQQWAQVRTIDRSCGEIASWVRAAHPTPGPYPGLALPLSFRSLSADGTFDALVTSDGRVILLLKTELGWHHNWTGTVCSSGPITPAEIGTDAYGRPMLLFQGLPQHFIEKQVDSRHFRVAFDLG